MKFKKSEKPKSCRMIYFSLLMILILTFPLNHSGYSLRPRGSNAVSNIAADSEISKMESRIWSRIWSLPDSSPDTATDNRAVMTNALAIVFTVVLIASSALLMLLFGYSNTVAPVKECLLLDLLREAIKAFFLINLVGYTGVVTCWAGHDQITIGTISAKFISYFYCWLTLHVLITLNAMALLKAHMAKKLMLDPDVPLGDGIFTDRMIFTWFRLSSTLGSLFFISMLYYHQQYPKLYYMLIGDDAPLSQLSLGAHTFNWTITVLNGTYMINSIRHQYYNRKGDNVAGSSLFPNGVYRMALIIAFVFGFMTVLREFWSLGNKGRIWIIILIYQIVITILAPVYIILATPKLVVYTTKTIKYSLIFFLNILNVLKPSCSFLKLNKRSTQIEPII